MVDFDPDAWYRAKLFEPLQGKPLTDPAVQVECVVASRICPDHNCKGEWEEACPVCQSGLRLVKAVLKLVGALAGPQPQI